ncbi:MAG: sulfatase [Allomuricauda sp.]
MTRKPKKNHPVLNVMAWLFCLFSLLTSCAQEEKPNFIVFFVDDLGWNDVGYMGSKYYETPNIDQMAREGMVFTNAYANAPNCAPSRAALLSGQYAPRHGVYTVGRPDRGNAENRMLIPHPNKTELSGEIVTMAEALKAFGYTNAHIGKWHLGNRDATRPEAQGFDINIAGNELGHPKSYFSPYKNPDLSDGKDGEYLTDRLTNEALDFIEDNKDGPFFVYFAHYAVHTPIQAKSEIISKYKDKKPHLGQDNPSYAAMVESMDQSIGRILQTLKKLKLDKNTLVLFFSDNGGHGGITNHAPLKGSKGMLYEGGIREPMIAWWPKKIEPNSKSDEVVIGTDFYPTLVSLAGGNPKDYPIDGEDLTPLFFQKKNLEREAVYWHFPAYLEGYHGIKQEEALTRGWRAVPSGAIRKGDWKLIEDFEDGRVQLYNIKEDISENTDLSATHPEKKEELWKDLKNWRKRINAPVPTKKNPLYKTK